MNSVWVPSGMAWEDWSDHPGWQAMDIDIEDPQFRWFLTEAACQTECDQRNREWAAAFRAQYDEYAARVEKGNEAMAHAHEIKVREHEALVAAGLRSPQEMRAAPRETAKSFEEWGKWRAAGPRWAPVEFKRSGADPQ